MGDWVVYHDRVQVRKLTDGVLVRAAGGAPWEIHGLTDREWDHQLAAVRTLRFDWFACG